MMAISPSDCTQRGCVTHCQTFSLLQYLLTSRNVSIGFQSLLIEYKVLLIVLKAQMGVAPKYLRDAIRLPTSASSLRPLRFLDRRELFVPRTRTTKAKSRSFSVAGPSLWNRLPPSARASFLSSSLYTFLALLKTCLF